MSWASRWVPIALVFALAAPVFAQDGAAGEVARLRALAATRPEEALAGLERLAQAGETRALRVDAARARAEVLRREGRLREAEAVWRNLLAGGVDVSPELLALAGARFTVTPGEHPSPGAPATVSVDGSKTGPIELRLYAVDAARWREARARDPERGLFDHLRAPPPAALRKLARWTESAVEGPRLLRTPAPLERGLYLLTATARGVTVSAPLVVSDALGVVRRGVGAGVLFLARRTDGAPLAGVALTAYDARGRLAGPLGRTGPRGVLRYSGAPAWAVGWIDGGPCVLRLLPARAPSPPLGLSLETDLPHYRPGQTLRLRVQAPSLPPKGTRWPLRLIEPSGVAVDARELKPDRAGVAWAALALPSDAEPGAWSLEVAGTRRPLRVAKRLAADLLLDLDLPPSLPGKTSALVKARLSLRASGLGVSGALAWRLLAAPAAYAWEAPASCPREGFAPRAAAPWREVASGEAPLKGGAASFQVRLPVFRAPHVLRLEATVEDGARRAVAVAHSVVGPHALVLAVLPERSLSPPREVVRVRLLAAHLDGRPAPGTDLVFRYGPRGGGAAPERRLRTREDGSAQTSLTLSEGGAVDVGVTAGDARAGTTLWIADARTRLAPTPRATLLLDSSSGRALAVFPFEGAAVLCTREGAEVQDARVELLRGAGRAWLADRPQRPGVRLVVSAVRDGLLHSAAAEWAVASAPLSVTATASRAFVGPGDAVVLDVETRDPEGRGRAAGLAVTLYPERTARALERRPSRRASAPILVRGLSREDVAPTPEPLRLAAEPLATVARALGERTNGAGRGRLRLTLPQASGRYWARVEGTDADGHRGQTWISVTVKEPLRLDVAGPAHLVEGDRCEVALRVRCSDPMTLLPDAALRVSWKGKGLKVHAPRIEGSRALLEGDPGSDTVRVAAAPDVRFVFEVDASGLGGKTLLLSASLEGRATAPRSRAHSIRVVPRGLSEERVWTGRVEPGRSAWIRLQLPADAVKALSTLRLAVDPSAATAALAGIGSLSEGTASGLCDALTQLVVRPAAARLLTERKLQGELPAPASLERTLARLAAARDERGAWGEATPSVLLGLLRLRRSGARVPASLTQQASSALDPKAPRTLWIRALAGLAPPVDRDPETRDPDARVFFAAARRAVGADPGAALGAALASVDRLTTTEARATLLEILALRGAQPKVQAKLLSAILLARTGPGWRDPDDACAASLALIEVARRAPERPGSRLLAFVEGDPLLDSFSGGGLAEWAGVAELSAVRNRSRVRVRSKTGDPLHYALAVRCWVRRALPEPEAEGVTLTRTLTRADGVAVTAARPGERLLLHLERANSAGASLPLFLEVPIPGGCVVLDPPAGFGLAGGVLRGALRSATLDVELLCRSPGEYTLLPARLTARRGPRRRATTGELSLKIELTRR